MARIVKLVAGAAMALGLFGPVAQAATCDHPGGFNAFIKEFRQEAARSGISQRGLGALDQARHNPQVIRLDRSQKSFRLSFEQFYARRVNNALIAKGRRLMASNARLFSRIEQAYGVPPAVITAIWGLETGYGANSGNMSIIGSLATLAHDCRRSAFFQNELMHALRIVDRGDMRPQAMRGAWAGEIGQTQFLASSYIKFAVDFDGDGRRDLIASVPDVLASTANYLRAHGWRRGQPWGPGTHNHEVLRLWNKASVYVRTIAKMSEQLSR